MKINVYKHLWPICVIGLLNSCASMELTQVDSSSQKAQLQLRWPAPPASPRIIFEQSFSTPDELGIGRSFWQWLGDVVFGGDKTHMLRPMDVVTVGEHLIFVADPGVRGVHRFDIRDQSYVLIQRKDEADIPSPVALSSDKEGNVYISDSKLAQLLVIRRGTQVAQPVTLDAPLQQPTGLAIDTSSGNIYLLDTAQHQVLVFSAAGQLKNRIGERGTRTGELNFPTHIQVKNKTLLVTDSLNFRIQLFDLKGRYLSGFGKAGQSSGYLSRPKGVAMNAFGHIYVVDSLLNNIQLFDRSGQLLMMIGEQGQQPGQFWLPTGIHINEQQKIYVADSHNRRVQVFRYIGKAL